MKVRDIPNSQFHLLASILHRPAALSPTEHASRVYCIESQLDRYLLRPDLLHRIIQLQPSQSHYTALCQLHKILNAKVVHELFLLLATEVGLRLNKLVVAGRDRLGHETWDRSILNLRALHGAWLETEVFWDTFGGTLDVPHDEGAVDYMTKWVAGVERKKCEACILTRIGSDIDTVFDLDMILRSRTHTRSIKRFREPRLIKLVEGWLKEWKHQYSADRWLDKLEWNRIRASRLKDVRREIRREERARKRQGNEALVTRTKSRNNQKVSTPIIKHEQQRAHNDKSLAHPKLPRTPARTPDTSREGTAHSKESSATHDTEETLVDSDNEDDHDKDIRQTLYATENDIIDSYAALISTPFLPGMGTSEHQKRASTLSKHSSTLHSPDQPSWPMVASHTPSQGLSRSQSTRATRPSTSSSSVYSQSSQFPPPAQSQASATAHAKPRRSQSTREHRTTDTSWVTASVAPSIKSQASMTKAGTHKRAPRYDQKFDTIAEEASSRWSSDRGYIRSHPISPVDDRTGGDSPVSPLSPVSPARAGLHNSKDEKREDQRKREPVRVKSKFQEDLSALEIDVNDHGWDEPDARGPKISSRLSRPFDGPVATGEPQAGTVLDSVRRLRQPSPPHRSRSYRDSAGFDVARWVQGQTRR